MVRQRGAVHWDGLLTLHWPDFRGLGHPEQAYIGWRVALLLAHQMRILISRETRLIGIAECATFECQNHYIFKSIGLKMLVVCGGMRRAGSTLQFLMVKKILQTTGQVQDHLSQEISEKTVLNYDVHNIIKAHRVTPEIMNLLGGKNSKALYIYRDIRDVLVSECQLLNIKPSIRSVFMNEIVGSVIEDFSKWKTVPNIRLSEYSKIMANLSAEVQSISEYLGVDISENQATKISNDLDLKNMKNRQDTLVDKSHKDNFDRKTMLHSRHINSGKSGQWSNYFTTSQVNVLESICEPWLSDQGFELQSKLSFAYFHKSIYYLLRKIRRVRNTQL